MPEDTQYHALDFLTLTVHGSGICFVKINEAGRNYVDGKLYKGVNYSTMNEFDGNFKVDVEGKIDSTVVLR
jgi:hypothetical protein